MKCANCGFELSDAANFCSNCGTPVQRTVTEAAPQMEPEMDTDASWEQEDDEDIVINELPEMEDVPEDDEAYESASFGKLNDDDDEDYDDFAYEERRAKRQARKKKKARDKVILFVLVGVILVSALAIVIVKSLSAGSGKENKQDAPSSSVVSEAEPSEIVSEIESSAAENADPNKLSAEDLTAAVTEIQQQYEAIMAKRTAGEYKASVYKDGITAYWDGDVKIAAIMAASGTEGSQYARSYFYDDNGSLFFADLTGQDAYRLYFKDGKLIRLSYAKDAANTADVTNYDQADSQEYTDWEASALDYSTTLMTEAKAAGIVKSQEEIEAEKAAEEERKKEEEAAKKAEEEKKAKEEAEKKAAEEKEDEKEEDSSSKKSGGYIFADSNSEYLAKSDLKELSQKKVRLALNEIYARRGAKFDNASNKEYFESKSWYKGTCSKAEAEKKFNKYERKNVDLIVEYEKSKGWR